MSRKYLKGFWDSGARLVTESGTIPKQIGLHPHRPLAWYPTPENQTRNPLAKSQLIC